MPDQEATPCLSLPGQECTALAQPAGWWHAVLLWLPCIGRMHAAIVRPGAHARAWSKPLHALGLQAVFPSMPLDPNPVSTVQQERAWAPPCPARLRTAAPGRQHPAVGAPPGQLSPRRRSPLLLHWQPRPRPPWTPRERSGLSCPVPAAPAMGMPWASQTRCGLYLLSLKLNLGSRCLQHMWCSLASDIHWVK